jgi:hypothetical protein
MGKAHPAEEARWVGSRFGGERSPSTRGIISFSPKLARANTSATSLGSTQRELSGPSELESMLMAVMPLARLQARWRGR